LIKRLAPALQIENQGLTPLMLENKGALVNAVSQPAFRR